MVEAAIQTCESNEKLRQNFQLCLEENCRGPVISHHCTGLAVGWFQDLGNTHLCRGSQLLMGM